MPLRKKQSKVAARPIRVYSDGEIQQRIANLPFSVQLVMMSAMESLIQCEIRESLTSLTAARQDVHSLQSHLNSLVVEGFQEAEAAREAATANAAAASGDGLLQECDDKDRSPEGDESTRPKEPQHKQLQPSSKVSIHDEVSGKTSRQ